MILEYVNAARADPAAMFDMFLDSVEPLRSPDERVDFALSFFDPDAFELAAQWSLLEPAPPLAWHDAPHDSAAAHNRLQIEFDEQSHLLPGEAPLSTRVRDAGYEKAVLISENVFSESLSVFFGHSAFVIDRGNSPTGI